MRDELGDARPFRQMAGIGGSRIQNDNTGTRGERRHQAFRHRADGGARHGEHNSFFVHNGRVRVDAIGAPGLPHPRPALRADLDMAHLEPRGLQVTAEPHAHSSARAEQCDRGHDSSIPSTLLIYLAKAPKGRIVRQSRQTGDGWTAWDGRSSSAQIRLSGRLVR
jgi:hypothetical protein